MNVVDWSGERIEAATGKLTVRLFLRDTGPRTDHALLFLHGFPTSSRDWSRIATAFADHRTLFVDLLGFGHSDKPRLRYSYPLHADLITDLLRRRGIVSVSLVAHDYSVTLAQELLRREQDSVPGAIRIERAVFLNGGVYGRLHRQQRFHKLLLTPLIGALVARRIRPEALTKGFNAIAGRRDAWSLEDTQAHWAAMAANGGLGRLPRLVHYIADRQQHGAVWEAAMERAADRIGFVWGPADPVSGQHVLDEVRARLPGVPSVALPGAGHYPQWELPEATADAVRRVLEITR